MIDVDVVPADPRPSDLEDIAGPKDGDPETIPLLPDCPPPEFSSYDAVYYTTATGDTVSHDPHLNEDGE